MGRNSISSGGMTKAGLLPTLADIKVHMFTHDDLRVGDVSWLTNNEIMKRFEISLLLSALK